MKLAPKPKVSRRPPKDTRVVVEPGDLRCLEAIHVLLSALNDPNASAVNVARFVEKIPVLETRINAEFVKTYPERRVPRLPEQIALLGNFEVEKVLLLFLEDLTILRAELDERAETRRLSRSPAASTEKP